MENVVVAFVAMDSELTEPHWLNRYAASAAPKVDGEAPKRPVIHCELFFPGRDKLTGTAYGIFFNGQVWKNSNKRYNRKNYLFKTVAMKQVQKKNALAFLDAQVGKSFNLLGYVSFLTYCKVSGNLPGFERKFYCSQLVMGALNASGVFGRGVTMHEDVHPHAVFDQLSQITTVSAHPVKMRGKLKFIL